MMIRIIFLMHLLVPALEVIKEIAITKSTIMYNAELSVM